MRSLADIRKSCQDLCEKKQVDMVFGFGEEHSPILLLGEAPGREEVEQGRPFVGKAGKNLDEFLQAVGLERDKLYVTNTVKFRPTRRKKGSTRLSNRPPKAEEIREFLPLLHEEIACVRPKVVVTLGNVALNAVLPFPSTIGQVHGKAGKGIAGEYEFLLFPLYHPASIIYNPALKAVYQEDLANLRTLIALDRK